MVAFAACFGAEFVLNWAVLPWLLSVPPRSLLGIALGIAPATAPIVLDRILVKLLGLTDTSDALSVMTGNLSRRLQLGARVVFLAMAGVATLYSIWVLSDSRAIASVVMNPDATTGVTPLQQRAIDLSLLMISMVLTVNGALFYLYGAHDIRRAWVIRQARALAATLRGALRGVSSQHAKAVEVLSTSREEWGLVDGMEKTVADTVYSHGRVIISEKIAQPPAPQAAIARVHEILGRRFDPKRGIEMPVASR
jgi:hypothetical protein